MARYFEPTGSVETRYRDIPFDDVKGCFSPATDEDRERWEAELRGQSITIWTPPIPEGFIRYRGRTHVFLRPPHPFGNRAFIHFRLRYCFHDFYDVFLFYRGRTGGKTAVIRLPDTA